MRTIVLAVLVLFVLGCGDDSSAELSRPVGTDRTITIPADQNGESWHIAASPTVTLGASATDTLDQFVDIAMAGRLPNGNTVVADVGSMTLRWFDESGVMIGQAGGRGEGPGEFRRITDVMINDDNTVAVYDSRNQRVTWFDANGEHASDTPLTGEGIRVVAAPSRDSLIFATTSRKFGDLKPEFNYVRVPIEMHVIAGGDTTAISHSLEAEQAIYLRVVDGTPRSTAALELPFTVNPIIRTVRGKLVVANGSTATISIFNQPDAEPMIVQGGSWPARPLGERERTAYVDSIVQKARSRTTMDIEIEAARQSALDMLALLPPTRTRPAFDQVLTGGDHIWLRTGAGDSQQWYVIDHFGTPVAHLTVPGQLQVVHVGSEFLTGIIRTSDDEQVVTVHRIDRSGDALTERPN